jgi:transcriptional regulator of met regulon
MKSCGITFLFSARSREKQSKQNKTNQRNPTQSSILLECFMDPCLSKCKPKNQKNKRNKRNENIVECDKELLGDIDGLC